MSKLAELQTEIEQKADAVRDLWDQADESGNEPDRATVEKLNREIEELEKRAADAKYLEESRATNDRRLIHLSRPAGTVPQPNGAANGHGPAARPEGKALASLGARFVGSAEFKGWLNAFPGGRIPDSTKGLQSPAIEVKDLITGVGSTSGGAFVVPDQSGIYDPLGRRPLSVRDLVSVRQTASDAVEYVRQLTRGNAAAPVAEATATAGASGTKPEGSMTFERVSETVKTIAEWVPITKRAASDAPQLRGIIDDELRADLEEELEDQMVNGNGVGENFTGLATVSGTQDQAFDTNVLTTTRKGRTKVRTVGRAVPTAYLLNPLDWEAIDLLQDNEARYYYGGPSDVGTPRLWGLRVVESEAVTAGTGWVGDWRRAVLWDREQATISVSDSHADFFIRNLLAVLAELRAAFGVIRPAAFVELDLTA